MSKTGGTVVGVLAALFACGYYAYSELGWFKPRAAPAAAPARVSEQPVEKSAEERARDARHVTPDLLGMTEAEARQAVSKAGFPRSGFRVRTGISCSYASDRDMRPQGTVCGQEPSPGVEVSGLTEIRVVIEEDTYEAGSLGFSNEWKRMPDLTGMAKDEALELLREQGFRDDEFEIHGMPGDCARGTVCTTRPEPGSRKVRARQGTLSIGG